MLTYADLQRRRQVRLRKLAWLKALTVLIPQASTLPPSPERDTPPLPLSVTPPHTHTTAPRNPPAQTRVAKGADGACAAGERLGGDVTLWGGGGYLGGGD
jgi:hypothetical protein